MVVAHRWHRLGAWPRVAISACPDDAAPRGAYRLPRFIAESDLAAWRMARLSVCAVSAFLASILWLLRR
jgi:hypothetical protein